jgi:hypothetical protein
LKDKTLGIKLCRKGDYGMNVFECIKNKYRLETNLKGIEYINSLEKEIEELKDELFEAYRMQLKGMVVGGQLDWIRNRMLELED